MDKDLIIKCIYILTGEIPTEKTVNIIAVEMGKYDRKTSEEYKHRYGKAVEIISCVDISKELSPRSRAEILAEVKSTLPEDERKRFGKLVAMLKIYLDGVTGV